jgi:hypothetical protein
LTPRFGKGEFQREAFGGKHFVVAGSVVVSFYVGFQFNVEGSEREKAKRKRVEISSSTNQRCTYTHGGISTVRTHLNSTQQSYTPHHLRIRLLLHQLHRNLIIFTRHRIVIPNVRPPPTKHIHSIES